MTRQIYRVRDTIEDAIRASQTFSSSQSAEQKGFDFSAQMGSGKTLLVGEGNLSFAKSLVRWNGVSAQKLVATTYEKFSTLNTLTLINAIWLQGRGVKTLYGVNARTLERYFAGVRFRTIVFQFPHTGRRRPVDGRNPNHVLVKQFLKSARARLENDGQVCITYVDNPHYVGAFQFETAAKLSGFYSPQFFPFQKHRFRGYTHVMTNEPSSGLIFHSRFKTAVFKPKF